MPPDARDRALAFLEAHHVLSLATAGEEGPWAAAVFYASRGFTLWFLSSPSSRHARNLAASRRAAATVQDDTDDWRAVKGLQLEGAVRLLQGAEAEEARALLGARFPVVAGGGPPEIAAALARVGWYRLTPQRLYLVDNAAGFGRREEVPL